MTPRWCDQRRHDGPRTQFPVLNYGKDSQYLRVKVVGVSAAAPCNRHVCGCRRLPHSLTNEQSLLLDQCLFPPGPTQNVSMYHPPGHLPFAFCLERRSSLDQIMFEDLSQHQNDTDKRLLYLIHIENLCTRYRGTRGHGTQSTQPPITALISHCFGLGKRNHGHHRGASPPPAVRRSTVWFGASTVASGRRHHHYPRH
jgi:hypothetical protein